MKTLGKFKLQELKNRWVSVVVLVVLAVGLAAGVVLVQQRQLFKKRAAGENASMSLPAQMAGQGGQQIEVPVYVNTDSAEVAGIDVVLNFDKAKLRLVDVDPRAATITTLKTFAPVTSSGSFDKSRVISRANQVGKIEFGAVSFDWQSDAVTGPFNGVMGASNPLAVLTFEELAAGQTTVTFDFTAGQTTDSNLVRLDTATDILAQVTNLTLSITTAGATGTPTGTLTPTVSPTPTIAAVSPTPTVTVAPDKVNVQFKIKFAGVNSKVPDQLVKIRALKAGETDTWFSDVPVTANNQGVFTGQVELTGITPGSGYAIYVKGPKHLARRFCEDGQTVRCGIFDGNLELALGLNEFDFSGLLLEPGDVPDPVNNNGEQDGIVNSTDYSLVKSRMYSQTNEDLAIADLNFDGIVNSVDVLLLRHTLETRYEDGY